MRPRLGILVNTNRYPGYVREVAYAARRRDKDVCIHFCGEGLELVDHPALVGLERLATVTGSARGLSGERYRADELSRFFQACDRCLVF